MSEINFGSDVDIRRIRRLLRAIADLAESSSMTGSLEKGARLGIRQYNALLRHLFEMGEIPEGLFTYLDEDDDSMDELGVASSLLASYLDEEAKEQEAREAQPVIAQVATGLSDAPELQELKQLGQLIRQHLPELLRAKPGAHAERQKASEREGEEEESRDRETEEAG